MHSNKKLSLYKHKVHIYSPGGNITALIETTKELDYARVAARVMAKNSSVEQVGFVMRSKLAGCDFHLEMMGGEFCGNASRCAAFYWANLNKTKAAIFTVSGFTVPLNAHIQATTVTARIPGEFLIGFKKLLNGWLADFHGMRFFVTEQKITKLKIKALVDKYVGSMPAMGVAILEASPKGYSITPWVWVKSTNTFIKETACASASIAASFALKKQGLDLASFSIIQPSGSVLSVGIEQQFSDITFSGVVKKVSHHVLL